MCTEIPEVLIGNRWLINNSHEHEVVQNALDGLVRCNPHLALLDHGNVVVQRDHLQREHVKILSGGPSGHEPSFAGFVGSGMLTAAVQGGIYTSPTPVLILRAIKALARRHKKGILVIIPDNKSDRISFGIAVERALVNVHMKVKFLRVADVCTENTSQQGFTGCLIVQKIAGAMAEEGLFLFDIYVYCKDFLDNITTVTVCLKPAISPYFEISSCTRTITEDVEFGAGFHGQAGFIKRPLITSHKTVKIMLKLMFEENLKLNPLVHVAVLINNLGKSAILEKLVITNEIVTQLQSRGITIQRVYTGHYITSLGMCGFSLTIVNLTNPDIIRYLDAKTDAPYWKTYGESIVAPDDSLILDTTLTEKERRLISARGPKLSLINARILEHALNFACGALISCEKQLNTIDSESGDGDTGTNIRLPATRISDYITKKKLTIQWPFMLFKELGKIVESSSDGIICRLYAIMFEAAAEPFGSLQEIDEITMGHWEQIFNTVCSAVERYGRTYFGKYTMYDALYKAHVALEKAVVNNAGPLHCMELATNAAEEAAKHTKLPGAQQPDPGAHAVGIWMRAVYEALKLYPDQCK